MLLPRRQAVTSRSGLARAQSPHVRAGHRPEERILVGADGRPPRRTDRRRVGAESSRRQLLPAELRTVAIVSAAGLALIDVVYVAKAVYERLCRPRSEILEHREGTRRVPRLPACPATQRARDGRTARAHAVAATDASKVGGSLRVGWRDVGHHHCSAHRDQAKNLRGQRLGAGRIGQRRLCQPLRLSFSRRRRPVSRLPSQRGVPPVSGTRGL